MKMNKLIAFILLLALLPVSCKDNKLPEEEIFRKYREKNLDMCVKTMLEANAETAAAIKKCNCMLDALFQTDSSFVRKSGDELNSFIRQNKNKLDSICNKQE